MDRLYYDSSDSELLVLNKQDSGQQVGLKIYTRKDIDKLSRLANLSAQLIHDMKVVSAVLPFRVNKYVVEELIDWNDVPNDPIFQMTFPQKRMIPEHQYSILSELMDKGAPQIDLKPVIAKFRSELNPHPSDQQELNVPSDIEGDSVDGLQHKYNETVLVFPAQGQTCHSYCSFCFRWAQFIGDRPLRFSCTNPQVALDYLKNQKGVTDVVFTGGDPLIMNTLHLERYLLPLLDAEFDHIQNIRIGTKALTFWPFRITSDPDSQQLLQLFSKLTESGKHLAIMAHFNNSREIENENTIDAIRLLKAAGAEIRSQGPLLANINSDSDSWARLWKNQVKVGVIPYYMFVERNTGASQYFEVPLYKAFEIYRNAISRVSGLARTARGPCMSSGPGKIEIQGITNIGGEDVFVLRFLQARSADWLLKPFFAKFDSTAMWLDDLQPAFGDDRFFFQDEYDAMLNGNRLPRCDLGIPLDKLNM